MYSTIALCSEIPKTVCTYRYQYPCFCRIFVFPSAYSTVYLIVLFCVFKACGIFVFFCRLNSVLIHGDSSVLLRFFSVCELNFNNFFRVGDVVFILSSLCEPPNSDSCIDAWLNDIPATISCKS